MSLSLSSAALDPGHSIKNYFHTSWTDKDGLSGAVLSLAQTNDGFLWIGSSDGLFRFDGLTLERYIPQEGSLLSDANIDALSPSQDGGLWIGYGQGGVSLLRNSKVTNFNERDGLPAGQSRSIVQDKDGVVWASFVGGLGRFDGSHWHKIQMDWNYPGKTAWSIAADHAGTIWVSSEDKVFFLPRGGRTFQDAGLSVTPGVVTIAPDNGLWFSEPHKNSMSRLLFQNGMLKRSGTEIEATDWTPIFDHGGGLWVGSWGDGILHVPSPSRVSGTSSRSDPGMETFTETEGLSDNHATVFLEDREGDIWVGTNGGLDRLRPRSVSWFALQPGTHSFSLIPNGDGEITASSAFGGMVNVTRGTPIPHSPRNVLLAYRDPDDGILWLNTHDESGTAFHGELMRWTQNHLTSVASPPGLTTISIHAMTKDHTGNLWVSVDRKGVYTLNGGAWTHVDIVKDFPNASAAAAITDSRGRVWLTFPRRKVLAVITDGAIKNYSTDRDLSIGPVGVIALSGEPIWVAGSLGIAFFLGDSFHNVRADDGSTFADVDAIVPTAFDGVWLSSHQKILHIPESEVKHVVSEPSYRVNYEVFDQLTDLPDPLQGGGDGLTSAVQGADGALWFATRNGVARIDPRKISRSAVPPPVLIQDISADGKRYVSDTYSSLPPLTRNLRINYSAISLSLPEKVRFKYRLDGWDTNWIDAGNLRQAFYTNLRPRRYRFHVIACNSNGVWNNEGATIEFSIAPAWFQTTWFYTLCVVAGFLVIGALYRIRVRQIAKAITARFDERLAERTRIARDLHDTFLQTIHGSKLLAESASKQSSDPVRMSSALEQLSVWLARAMEEGRAALNSLRTSATESNDLAEAFRRAMEECRIATEMEVTFSVVGHSTDMHPIVRDEVYRIGYEAIRNACVHSRASRLEVTLRYGHELNLRIADNGVGMAPSIADHGKEGHFGLRGMRERAARISGNLSVVSSRASGTEIRLAVPGQIIFRRITSETQ
ncbi:MAG TPA: two-component regulator propeller domain-containing protein [Acidobacteriaceae bacterium]|jgi:signal transduction histidine kinase/ligand-binding sensor domain-containing protein